MTLPRNLLAPQLFALLGVVLIAAMLPIVLVRKGTGSGRTAHRKRLLD